MSYPSPLAVREVKNILKTGAMEMGVVGASTVVDALISSLWGTLFSRDGSRDYYNFIGEVAHRTLSPRHVRVVESAAKNNFPYSGFETYNPDTNQTEKIGLAYNPLADGKSTNQQMKFRIIDQYSTQQNNNNNSNKNKNKNKNPNQQNQNKNNQNNNKNPQNNNKNLPAKKNNQKNFSSCPNLSSLTSHNDFSFRSWVKKVKSLFTPREKKAAQQEVLLGCYEYLEDNGYDAYPVMLDILNRQVENKNFSETSDYPISVEEIEGFVDAVKKYKSLENGERAEVDKVLKEKFGEEGFPLFTDAVGKISSKSISKGDLWFLKVMGILGAVITIVRLIFPPRQKPDTSNVSTTKY